MLFVGGGVFFFSPKREEDLQKVGKNLVGHNFCIAWLNTFNFAEGRRGEGGKADRLRSAELK